MMAKDIYRFIQTAVGQQMTGSNFYPSTLDIQDSLKSGWLRKQGGVVKSWQRRWFTIKGDYMYYYSTQDESKSPLGVIFLPGSRVIEHAFNVAEPDKFLFEIAPESPERPRMAPTHETYPLAAESDEERKDWIKSLKQVLYASVGGAIFGRPLKDTLDFEKVRDRQRKVPEIVQSCSDYILKKGIDEEGIFRLPGRSVLIKRISDEFDRGDRPDIDVPEMDVHTAASLLKSYLRDLPSPLIPAEFYESVMRIIMRELPLDDEKALARLCELIRSIPVDNYNVLHYVCQFLGKVASHSNKNKMTSVNLATVFVQAFIRPEDDDPALLMATASSRTVVTLVFIERCDRIFKVEYTSDGAAVVVDDLLGLGCGEEDFRLDSSEGRGTSMSLNPDLFGLEFNGNDPAPSLRRHNAGRVLREASMSQDQLQEPGKNRRGGVYQHDSQSGNENSSSSEEVLCGENEKMPPENRSEAGGTAEVQDANQAECEGKKKPVAPPRALNRKPKPGARPVAADTDTALVGNDSAAVEALLNIDTRNFSESDLRAHIDRLCQELVIRQKIIEDLNEKAQLSEQKHVKQIDALLQKMSESRTNSDRRARRLRLYKEKYGPLE